MKGNRIYGNRGRIKFKRWRCRERTSREIARSGRNKKFHAIILFPYYGKEKKEERIIRNRSIKPSTFVVRRQGRKRERERKGKKRERWTDLPVLSCPVPAARGESKKLSDILDGNEEETMGRRERGSELRNSRTGSIFYGFVCLHRRRKMKPVMRRH